MSENLELVRSSKGVPIDAERGYVFDIRHGKVLRFAWFNDPHEALKAVGLPETGD